jgi:hypothetical protein
MESNLMETLAERFEVLRDEGLNTAEYGRDAPGTEIFEAILCGLTTMGETEPGLDMSLLDSLSRRLAWGENASTIVVDCDSVCKRLLAATHRSFSDPEEATKVASVITEVACAASRHIARLAVQGASKERAQQRREAMVQRQLAAALSQQEALIAKHTRQNKS